MINTFVNYTDATQAIAVFYPGTASYLTSLSIKSKWHISKTTGKVAYVTTEKEYDTFICVKEVYYNNPHAGNTLFISNKSKIPRALLRNSGYNITYNKDKADYVVVPELDNTYPFLANFVVKTEADDCLLLLNIHKADQTEYKQHEIDWIENYIRQTYGSDCIVYHNSGEYFKTFFLPKVEEYQDVLLGKLDNYKWVVDSQIPLTGGTQITPENLVLWGKCNDENIVEKTILNSNWQEYPATICTWIYDEGDFMEDHDSPQWDWLMKCIKYGDFLTPDDNRFISEQDWNMIQDYLLYRMGLTDKGFVTKDKMGDMKSSLINTFLRTKIAVSPMKVHGDHTLTNLISMVKNDNHVL